MWTSICVLAASLAARVSSPHEAPTIATLFRAGEETVWTFEADGKRIGHHQSKYLGRDDTAGRSAHHFQGRLRLAVDKHGTELRSNTDLWTQDDGRPVRFTLQGTLGDAYSRVDLEFDGPDVKAHIVQGPSVRDLTLEADPAAFLLANNYISHLEIVVALNDRGEDASLAMFSGNTLQGFTYQLKAKGAFETEVGGAKTTGRVYEDSFGERIRVAGGRILDVEIASQKIVIKRSDEKFEAFTIVPPEVAKASSSFDGEDVKIARGDAVIAGRITKPPKSTKPDGAKGRLPAVFFVSGSGAQDRNGMSSGIDLGTHEILDRLTNDGFLVLRVDDRGAGESSPPPADMSFTDLVDDARACVAHLKSRADVDASRIAVIGHSEGGETAPLLAAEDPTIAAIVLMAAPGRSLLEIMTDQNRMALELAGKKGEELEKELAEVVALLKRLCGSGSIDPSEIPEDQRAILQSRAWLRTHAEHDPIATIRKVKCPVLVLQGAKDFQVSLDRDARALEKALADAKHPDFQLVAFDKLDHLFKASLGEKSEFADYMKGRPVDPEFLSTLSDWLRKRLGVR